MRRKTFDLITSWVGVLLAVLLLVAGGLLNAYAFGQIGQIARWAAIAAFAGGVVFLALSVFGFLHMRRTPADADLQATRV